MINLYAGVVYIEAASRLDHASIAATNALTVVPIARRERWLLI